MKLVVLGRTLSQSAAAGRWAEHAAVWRPLLEAFARLGHEVLFLAREGSTGGPGVAPEGCELETYADLAGLKARRAEIASADAVIVGSGLEDGAAVSRMIQRAAPGVKAFYDLDAAGAHTDLGGGSAELIPAWDLYLSAVGGPTLELIERRWQARVARALYASIEADPLRRQGGEPAWDLGCLIPHDADIALVEWLVVAAARQAQGLRFALVGGAGLSIDLPDNVQRLRSAPVGSARAFFGACRYVLSLGSQDRNAVGFWPRSELFEAAVSGAAVIAEPWPGLSSLFTPDREIRVADDAEALVALLRRTPEPERLAMADAARRRVFAHHTAGRRAEALEDLLIEAREGRARSAHTMAWAPLSSVN